MALQVPQAARAQRANYEELVATHAKANLVPEALVHRVILHESRYQPGLTGRGGAIGLMQIKLSTARSLGYAGDAEGLRDPGTNLAYGVKYLAGAYRTANGDHVRAMHYYASGYYFAAKRQRLAQSDTRDKPKANPDRKPSEALLGRTPPQSAEAKAAAPPTEPDSER